MSVETFFDEVQLDGSLFNLGFAKGSPEFANANLKSPVTGVTKVAVQRQDPQWLLSVDFDDVQHDDDAAAGVDYFLKMWYGGYASAYGFRVRLEWDHKLDNEVIAVGDGILADFKLTKEYNRPGTSGHSYVRRIIKPVVTTNLTSGSATLYEPDGQTPRVVEIPFQVFVDEDEVLTGWTIKNTTGVLHFTTPPAEGAVISVTCQFDVPFQFWTNNFQLSADWPASLKGLQILEILPATLGIE